jgi:SAM-dependent methyltransferase
MKKFWNERYDNTKFAYGLEPNDFLVFASQHLTARSKILSLGEGEGRNALFLAKAGHDVVAVDQSDIGMAKAQKIAQQANCNIETVVADLADLDMGANRYDAIISIFCHLPLVLRKSIHARIKDGLREGGIFIIEAYAPEQLQNDTGGPKDRDMLVSLNELTHDFANFEPLHAYSGTREVNEGEFHHGMAVVTQYIGKKSTSKSG